MENEKGKAKAISPEKLFGMIKPLSNPNLFLISNLYTHWDNLFVALEKAASESYHERIEKRE